MLSKANWEETKQKWTDYWNHENKGRPLMCVIARKPEIEEAAHSGEKADYARSEGFYWALPEELKCVDTEDRYLNPEKLVARYRHFCNTHEFLGESFPNMNVDLGPGCLAAYLGADVEFRDDTIWYHPVIEEWEDAEPFRFDPESPWFKRHVELAKRVKELAGEDFLVTIPDIMENLDVIGAMRGTMDVMYDLLEEEDELLKRVGQITDCYQQYYDSFYDIVKGEDGGVSYMVFQIWGPGKTVKLQCDIATMISPKSFRDLVLESLRQQARNNDHSLFHLDGKECIRHLDALMEIEELDALQFTSGDAGPDGTLTEWYEIYDKAIAHGKSIWVKVYSGEFEDWIRNAERIVMRYGSDRLFFHFPEMSLEQAHTLLDYAEKNWSNIRGTYREEIGI